MENIAPFLHFNREFEGRPFIVAQLGQSLDGRIATYTGDSRNIGAAPSIDHLHRIRAHVDAVLVGIGTVLADDPQLNVRRCEGENPARIILDAKGLLQPQAKCLSGEDGVRRVVVRAENSINSSPLEPDVEIIYFPVDENNHFDMKVLSVFLLRMGFEKILIEGGAAIVSAAIEKKVVDRLHILVSSVILGSGKTGLNLSLIDKVSDAIRPKVDVYQLGAGDVLFDCGLS